MATISYDPLIFILMYATAVIFSVLAADSKDSYLSSLIAAITWTLTGLTTFILGPTAIGIAFAWLMGALSFVFVGVVFLQIFTIRQQRRDDQRDPRAPI